MRQLAVRNVSSGRAAAWRSRTRRSLLVPAGAMLEKETYTFMYEDGNNLIIMHPTSFEQASDMALICMPSPHHASPHLLA